MSCNRGVHASGPAAATVGVPDLEQAWADHRSHPRFCPSCHGFLRGDGGCTRCEGATFALASPAVAEVVAAASASGEKIPLERYWGTEFAAPDKGGREIRLQNGEVFASGKRFTDPAYCVPLGKAKQLAVVGQTITPAVGQVAHWQKLDNGVVKALTVDGGAGYYDPGTRAACCAGPCADSRGGLCHHQMAAVITGELMRSPAELSDAQYQLQEQLAAEMAGRGAMPVPTAGVMRSSDAAYAYLKAAVPDIQANVAGLLPPEPPPPPAVSPGDGRPGDGKKPAVKGKSSPKVAKSGNGKTPALRGNADVAKLMNALSVRPPLPTVAEQLDKDPTLAGYEGFPVPTPDPRYEVGQQEREIMTQIMQRTGQAWQMAARRVAQNGGDPADPAAYPASMEDRCWGLYGPPGTGKNSLAKEIAASLGLGYMEIDVRDRSDFQALLCDVTFPKEGDKTYSEVRLGPIGQALTSGNVVAINEIVAADPDAQTALHQVLQDGIIRAPGPEGATKFWRVHPNSLVFLTWNPNTTRQDKPAPALLSRTPSLEVGYPEPQDEARRLASAMSDYLGREVTPAEVKRPVNLVRGLRELHLRGDLETCPTYREMVSFAKSWFLGGGDRQKAGAMFKVLCSQAPGRKDDEWKQVHNLIDSFQEGTWKV